jgi:hypothetical protein
MRTPFAFILSYVNTADRPQETPAMNALTNQHTNSRERQKTRWEITPSLRAIIAPLEMCLNTLGKLHISSNLRASMHKDSGLLTAVVSRYGSDRTKTSH